MATQNNLIPGTGYGSTYIDSLVWGCGWNNNTPIRYYFGQGPVSANDSSIGAFTGRAWTATEKNAFRTALSQYSAVCNLTFVEATSPSAANADIVWWLANQASMGSGVLGMHEVPDNSGLNIYGYFNSQDPTWSNLNVGSYGYITIIHELGHGLGLAHPHDGGDHNDATTFPGVKGPWSTGSYGLNQGIWTTMSYNDGWNLQPSSSYNYGYQGTPMALDIAALQALYGANTNTATGDNIYQLPSPLALDIYWSCLWDAGGTDTISNSSASTACTINLNAAPLVGANAGGYVSWNKGIPGGYTIANNVIIENATGGNGNDILIGNAADNQLDGGPGIDQMSGGLGNDTYYVTAGDVITEGKTAGGIDTIVASTSWVLSSTDIENLTLSSSAGIANATGSSGANTLTGNDFANALNGGTGNDVLIGKGGLDTLTGGRGNDVFKYLAVTDSAAGNQNRDVITDFSKGDLIDLRAIDANTNTGSNDAFTYIGSAPFTAAGQVRFALGILAADTNGDASADFEVQLLGVSGLNVSAVLL